MIILTAQYSVINSNKLKLRMQNVFALWWIKGRWCSTLIMSLQKEMVGLKFCFSLGDQLAVCWIRFVINTSSKLAFLWISCVCMKLIHPVVGMCKETLGERDGSLLIYADSPGNWFFAVSISCASTWIKAEWASDWLPPPKWCFFHDHYCLKVTKSYRDD